MELFIYVWWDCLLDGEEIDREDVSKPISKFYKALEERRKNDR